MQLPQPSDISLRQRLSEAGVTPTAQRLAIARVLFERARHVSADQLIELLAARSERAVSKATVYNTLGLFARVGLVREVFADPERVMYDSNTHAHHHIFDVESGTLTDIPPEDVHLSELPELGDGMELAGVDIVIRVRPRRG